MTHWYMLTLVGEDRAGIVARVTQALYEGGCNLGEASMMRLGGNFTVMMMVSAAGTGDEVRDMLDGVVAELGLRLHIDGIEGRLHQHVMPDVRVTVAGADRAGIVAQVAGALAGAGFNILELESDVAGSERAPLYIMHIEGVAAAGVEAVRAAVEPLAGAGIDVRVSAVETLIG